jgi:hypothetical protein
MGVTFGKLFVPTTSAHHCTIAPRTRETPPLILHRPLWSEGEKGHHQCWHQLGSAHRCAMAVARRGEGGAEWLVLLARVSPCFACGSNMHFHKRLCSMMTSYRHVLFLHPTNILLVVTINSFTLISIVREDRSYQVARHTMHACKPSG